MRSQLTAPKLFFSLFVFFIILTEASSQELPNLDNITWKSSRDAEIALLDNQIIEPSTNATLASLNYSEYFSQYVKYLQKNLGDNNDVPSSLQKAINESSSLYNSLNLSQDEVAVGFNKIIDILRL